MKQYVKRGNQDFSVKVDYDKGGMNYFSGNMNERGYYLYVTPIKLEKHDGYTMETFTMFSGTKKLLLTCKRKSDKQYQQALEMAKEWIDTLINHVIVREKIDVTAEVSND